MAKVKQQNSIEEAIRAITGLIRAEGSGFVDPSARATAANQAMDIVDNSGLITVAQHSDDNIETAHQVDAVLEEGGINPVQHRRDSALAAAEVVAADANQPAIEQAGELEAGEQAGEQD